MDFLAGFLWRGGRNMKAFCFSDYYVRNGWWYNLFRVFLFYVNVFYSHVASAHNNRRYNFCRLLYAASGLSAACRKENNELILIINDNGKGFDTSTKRKGIGLINIKSRAAIHHGKVQILSAPGNGCTMK